MIKVNHLHIWNSVGLNLLKKYLHNDHKIGVHYIMSMKMSFGRCKLLFGRHNLPKERLSSSALTTNQK